jgi:ADP-heptose:LPS heptosyltransferase
MKKILLIRFSSIGDIVLTSPLLRTLKKQMKNCEIHFLTKKQFLPVLQANPHIDKLHLLDDNMKALLRQLQKEEFDVIIDLHKNLRSLRVKASLRKTSYSFDKINLLKFLSTSLKINKLPKIHIVDRYFESLKPLSIINDGQGLEYYIPQNEEVNIKQRFPQIASPYNVWVIGGQHQTKIFPRERIINILRKTDEPFILLGGAEDAKTGDFIAGHFDSRVVNASGQFSLNQSASILRQSRKVYTNDTGLMHIAAAFHKIIISFWGNTIPGFGMYPYLSHPESKMLEVKNLSCRPCSKIGFQKCPKGHFKCMMDIPEEDILSTFDREDPI